MRDATKGVSSVATSCESSNSLVARLKQDRIVSPPLRKSMVLSLLDQDLEGILRKHGMRKWNCIIPSPSYPLSSEGLEGSDPKSLSGRTIFTPAEDDLLLRGLVSFGEDWAKISSQMIPSKSEQLLQFRCRQLLANNSNTPENNRIKRYYQLEKEKRTRGSNWTHNEDLNLLRGMYLQTARQ